MQEQVSIIVLSGGQSRRFGHADKGLIPWRGKPLIEHVISRLQPQSDQILISCNRNLETYLTLGLETFTDRDNRFLGPLAGVQAAAAAVSHPWCLLCPNDTPQLPDNLVATLLDALKNSNCQVAYPVCGSRHHYLPALIRSDILPGVTAYLNKGGRSLHGWFQEFRVAEVDYSDQADKFANINSPAELTELG